MMKNDTMNRFFPVLMVIWMAACSTVSEPRPSANPPPPPTPAQKGSAQTGKPAASGTQSKSGGYYLDDGPGDNPPADLDNIPDAVPKPEPLIERANQPYKALGKVYVPMTVFQPYKAKGLASWYGRRYHGNKTSSGEVYNMYAMTAAHTILPIPSYVRVTNPGNGRSVIVKINDRGPFYQGRLIDLSYAAAYRLGTVNQGRSMVEVEAIDTTGAAPREALPPASSAPGKTVVGNAQPEVKPLDDEDMTLSESPPPDKKPVAPSRKSPVSTKSQPISRAPAPVADKAVVAESPSMGVVEDSAPAAAIGGVFLQLGAFQSTEAAKGLMSKAEKSGLTGKISISKAANGMNRVLAGPFRSEAEARQAAAQIGSALGVKPFIKKW